MNELDNPYAELLNDFDIIREHKHEFAEPLWIIVDLCNLNLSEDELLKTEDYQRFIAKVKEIYKQGYLKQFVSFINIVWGTDF